MYNLTISLLVFRSITVSITFKFFVTRKIRSCIVSIYFLNVCRLFFWVNHSVSCISPSREMSTKQETLQRQSAPVSLDKHTFYKNCLKFQKPLRMFHFQREITGPSKHNSYFSHVTIAGIFHQNLTDPWYLHGLPRTEYENGLKQFQHAFCPLFQDQFLIFRKIRDSLWEHPMK